ncbi:MAG: restriction endonuclease subunit S [Chromatiaceae bacterium]|jgi:type I restriction enzyme S subunit|nr:restriction endonuclease subunit S [Chromatiaceae bacterium]
MFCGSHRTTSKLGALISIRTGKLNSNAAIEDGAYPFFTCSREVFRTGTYSFDCEAVLLAGNNAAGVYPLHYFSGKFDAYQRTYVLETLNAETLLNRYLYYALQPKLELLRSISTGAATKFLTLTILRDLEIHLPPVAEQRKIAAILSAYDGLIENNLRRIKILEEMAQNLYREWFVKFRFPGHGQARMIDSPCGKIPEKWALTPLGKIASLRKDKFDERLNAELPLLDLAKMRSRTLMVAETGTPAELTTSRILFQEDDILFGSIRPYLHKVALAPFQGVTNVSVLVLRPTAEFLRSFLAVLLSSEDTIRWADKHSTGTKMPVIKWEALASMLVPMPPPNLLNVFEASVQPMLQTVKTASSRNRNLRRTRDLLLPKLISGELDISELDIAVPEEQAA